MDIKATRKLNNGVEIPLLGLGVFRMEGENTPAMVAQSLQVGYTHIDTASAYNNEEGVAEGIARSGIAREKLFITTKLGTDDIRAGRAREALEESLTRLGTEYVDLYLIHWPVPGYEVAWKALEQFYAEGKARAIGVSNFNPRHLEAILPSAKVVPAVNQFEIHPHFSQVPLRSYCENLGIAAEAYSPLGGLRGNDLSNPVLVQIGAVYGKTPAQVILRWNLQHNIITIPKSAKAERVRENAELFDFTLTSEEMQIIDGLNEDRRSGSDPEIVGKN